MVLSNSFEILPLLKAVWSSSAVWVGIAAPLRPRYALARLAATRRRVVRILSAAPAHWCDVSQLFDRAAHKHPNKAFCVNLRLTARQ